MLHMFSGKRQLRVIAVLLAFTMVCVLSPAPTAQASGFDFVAPRLDQKKLLYPAEWFYPTIESTAQLRPFVSYDPTFTLSPLSAFEGTDGRLDANAPQLWLTVTAPDKVPSGSTFMDAKVTVKVAGSMIYAASGDIFTFDTRSSFLGKGKGYIGQFGEYKTAEYNVTNIDTLSLYRLRFDTMRWKNAFYTFDISGTYRIKDAKGEIKTYTMSPKSYTLLKGPANW